jgi:mannose-6-phosphate isomerase
MRGTRHRSAEGIGVRSRPLEVVVRPWGNFSTLEEGPGYKIKRLVVAPGQRLSLQKHRHRAEHWVLVAGTAVVLNGASRLTLKRRQCTVIPRGAWHRVENPGRVPLVIIEVQHGAYLGEDDILRKADDYGRAGKSRAPRVERRVANAEGRGGKAGGRGARDGR